MNAPVQDVTEESGAHPENPTSQPTRAGPAIVAYLREHVSEFCYLEELRAKGWANPEGDAYFRKQRKQADKTDKKTAQFFYTMMKSIAKQLQDSTSAFQFAKDCFPIDVLDFCMAPGGFVSFVLDTQRVSSVRAFSLPVGQGGHEVLVESDILDMTFTDVTMLAGDMGVDGAEISSEHPDADDFRIERLLSEGEKFDLVVCDGQVLRTHKRSSWREGREARRLTLVQLSLGLEHVKPGGTMVILLHKLESWASLQLLQQLHRISKLQLFKSSRYHATRSSFYAVATKVQSGHQLAVQMVVTWKQQWRVSTFGAAEEYRTVFEETESDAVAALESFGETYVALGRHIWATQAKALNKAPYVK